MKKLTKEQQAVAINLALDFEQEKYNHFFVRGYIKEFCKKPGKDLKPLYDFWKNTNDITRRAYLAVCYYINEESFVNG